jgi:hypothetical protein
MNDSDTGRSGKNVVDGFRQLRQFCKDVALLLNEANKMMEQGGWKRISKRTKAVETFDHLDLPEYWLPDAFFCFYEHAKRRNLLPYIAIHVDDLWGDPDYIREPIISAGWLDYGVGKEAGTEWGKDYWLSYLHLWMSNRTDDGTRYTGDVRKLSEDEDFSSGVTATTFAHPLDVIKSSEELRKEIVKPLLKLLS